MRNILSSALGIVLLSVAGTAAPETINIGETSSLHSDILDEDRTLLISLPDGYEQSPARYPVLYLLDGRGNFHHTTGTLRTLTDAGRLPEMIVVGITNSDRTRDLTPTPFVPDPDDEDEDEAQEMATAGGADKFLDFMEQELFPHIEMSYRTAPYRVLIGHSFGGLFVVHALIERPDSFDAYIAISPSLWWVNGVVVDRAESLFSPGGKFAGKTLYMSLADEGNDMYTYYRRFEELLRYKAPEGLAWQAMMMEGDDHGSTTLRSTYHGLQFVYPRWRLPRFADGLEDMRRHFARLSTEYGYEIELPQGRVNRMGYHLLQIDKIEEAIAAFQFNVEHYPDSANVHDSLGDGLKEAGRLTEALASYERACELADEDHPNLEWYQRNRDQLQDQLEADS